MRMLFEMDKKDYKKNGTVCIRPSVRGIIIKNGKIAMIHSLKYDYYKFPGGGTEEKDGENHFNTLIREVREESGLVVIPSSIKEYGQVHRVQKGVAEDIFIQDNFYYLCSAEEKIKSQELDKYENEEKFVLEFTDPETAIEKNNAHINGLKDKNPHRNSMLEREVKVLELLIKEKYI